MHFLWVKIKTQALQLINTSSDTSPNDHLLELWLRKRSDNLCQRRICVISWPNKLFTYIVKVSYLICLLSTLIWHVTFLSTLSSSYSLLCLRKMSCHSLLYPFHTNLSSYFLPKVYLINTQEILFYFHCHYSVGNIWTKNVTGEGLKCQVSVMLMH